MATPVCKDCIAAGLRAPAATTLPCDGLTFDVTSVDGRSETATAYFKDNPMSLISYDIYFDIGGMQYSIVYNGATWTIVDKYSTKVWYSPSTGPNNNACPPRDGWVDASGGGIFSYVGVSYLTAPGPSNACDNSNGTFDTNLTGWTASNITWSSANGGTAKYDTTLLGSISQNILTVGETYKITLDYSSAAVRDACTPTQYSAGFLQISAGTKVARFPLDNTLNEVGLFKTISTELTCEGNTTLKIEIQDPNQCYSTVSGFKGSFIDNVCVVKTTIVTDPTGDPSPASKMPYKDMAEVPAQINGKEYNIVVQSYQECLAKKGTTFYNKVIGAVKCDDRELQKLKLIIGLLGQKDADRALDCVYDKSDVITAVYPELPTGNLPVLTEGQTSIVVDGDLSQFETFTFHIQAATDYAVLEGSIVKDTTVSAIYIAPGGLPFLILGYTFSLLNNLGDYYATSGSNYVANILYSQAGPPLNNTIIPSGTIGTPTLFTVANSTTWALYENITASTVPVDFSTTIVDAVYDPTNDATTLLLKDAIPGTIGAATYEVEFVSENLNTYLKTFTDFANRFCADCIITVTPSVAAASGSLAITTTPLKSETGVPITTEFNQQINI